MEHIAWDHLDPIQQAQLAHLRPDVYQKVKDEQLEAQMDEQGLIKKEGEKDARE